MSLLMMRLTIGTSLMVMAVLCWIAVGTHEVVNKFRR